MALQHVRIKALKSGVTVAGLVMQSGQILEIDLDPSQYQDALRGGDIAVDTDGKTDLTAIAAEDVSNPIDNAPKAFTPQHSQIPEVTGATPDADKAVTDAKAKRGPAVTPKAEK